MKADIKNLEDIRLFVDKFYHKVAQDQLIGPVFADAIEDWAPHLEKMYQFWNAALFGVPGFRGNPFAKHAPLPINAAHFDRWLSLFNETIDENFEGEMAEDAKNRAVLMAEMFLRRLRGMTGGAGRVIM
ncbi:group III truncated hemoglobin [Pedobacter cryoconitis]|uniref:Hemoglobin n=1 Tax=Pedobacter cryoconitis TaxID=188932 RepID=A0A7X0J6E2_9SPHI|nr:group III truncated hemoglobin [Pedobacter cryoconitis]MBB6501943.1 hemoglobin [Pedobacter cryoconitis]